MDGILKQAPEGPETEIGDGGDLTSCECGTCVSRRSPPSPISLRVDNEASPCVQSKEDDRIRTKL